MSGYTYHWAVIGAGPAGIAAIAKLLDSGVSQGDIIWLDPYFEVGDMGRYWSNVSSNTKAKYFSDFLRAYKCFDYHGQFELSTLDQNQTCMLSKIVEPLMHITKHLRTQVINYQTWVTSLTSTEKHWLIDSELGKFKAQKVILAPGCQPQKIAYMGLEELTLNHAIDIKKLKSKFQADKTYAVFGSSHSAIIVIKNLVELGAKFINFYKSPIRYALEMNNWILFDNTGLKGDSAIWAKANIHKIERCLISASDYQEKLKRCDIAIYAVGFERRKNIIIDGQDNLDHNPQFGILAPNLFGLGIAYPELKTFPYNYQEYNVGIWKFQQYLDEVFSIWQHYT